MLASLSRYLRILYQVRDVRGRVARFGDRFDRMERADADDGDYDFTETVNDYYELCSGIMQFGWGESLHFAPLTREESLEDSVVRHQRLMIEEAGITRGHGGCRCRLRRGRSHAAGHPRTRHQGCRPQQ